MAAFRSLRVAIAGGMTTTGQLSCRTQYQLTNQCSISINRRSCPNDQQVGISGLGNQRWTSRPTHHFALQGNPSCLIRGPHQRGRYDLSEFVLGSRLLLGEGRYRFGGGCLLPPLHQDRHPAANRAHPGPSASGVRQCPAQRGVASRGAVHANHH